MSLKTLERRRVPIGLGLLLVAVWLALGIRRTVPESGAAVLDSPVHVLAPRTVAPGWHLVPPGLLRISIYPIASATFAFSVGGDEVPLVSHEGTELVASGTIRYRIDTDRLLEVHRNLGLHYEQKAIAPWMQEVLRGTVAAKSYTE